MAGWLATLACAALGPVVGPFLNVVIARVPERGSVSRPGSAYPAGGDPIRPRDNVPVVSWLLLRGRCRDCGAPASARHPIVEAGTAALSGITGWRFGYGTTLPVFLLLAALRISLSAIDLDTRRLPHPEQVSRVSGRDRSGEHDSHPARRLAAAASRDRRSGSGGLLSRSIAGHGVPGNRVRRSQYRLPGGRFRRLPRLGATCGRGVRGVRAGCADGGRAVPRRRTFSRRAAGGIARVAHRTVPAVGVRVGSPPIALSVHGYRTR